MKPVVRNLELYRGDTWSETFRLWNDEAKTEPTDLSGATAKAQIKAVVGSGVALVELNCDIGGDDNNEITVSFLPAQWTGTILSTSKAVWDLQVTFSPELVTTYVKGSVSIDVDVTDPETP